MLAPSRQRTLWFADQVLPHEPALRAWLARRVRDWMRSRLDIDDVVQESYAILARLEDVAHIQNPRAYLFRTAQSVILQHVRRARIVAIDTVAEIDRLQGVYEERSPERNAEAHQALQHVGVLIASLPPRCQKVFVLRKVHGLSQREIATHLGISESTVEKHIAKGVCLLAAAMTQAQADERPERGGIRRADEQGAGHGEAQ